MSIFETVGEAALLRAEGDRQLASTLAQGWNRLLQSVTHLFGRMFNNVPDQHPLP
jgi:hypothetical protein